MVAFGLGDSCASAPTKPLSAEEHLAEAQHHERKAEEHEGKHHVEWTTTANAAEEAARYRAIAAQHRAASDALRTAEARACAGIEDDDRDESPFVHATDIVEVNELTTPEGKQRVPRRRGARITVRAVRGLTAQWLKRLIDCRIAENAALGYEVPEFPNDPLAVPGATARVTDLHNAFAVDIEHESPERAREIQRRAATLRSSAATRSDGAAAPRSQPR
jgi:hypothetical protein